jgi:siderophore synthetase component
MTEGHPGFVANNGRVGFGLDGYERYAPEAGGAVRLVWLACRRDSSRLSSGEGLTEEDLYGGELDDAVREQFAERLRALGLDPAGAPASRSMQPTTWSWQTQPSGTTCCDRSSGTAA